MNCSCIYQKKKVVLLFYSTALLPKLGQKFTNCYPLTPRDQRKLVSTRFNLENILSSLALETGIVNDILIINSTLLEPLLLGAVKIFLPCDYI